MAHWVLFTSGKIIRVPKDKVQIKHTVLAIEPATLDGLFKLRQLRADRGLK